MQANVVLDCAADLVDSVIAGDTFLNAAYEIARARKQAQTEKLADDALIIEIARKSAGLGNIEIGRLLVAVKDLVVGMRNMPFFLERLALPMPSAECYVRIYEASKRAISPI